MTATTADEVLADATHVDVIKIDTDGYDGQVLQGARQVLRTHRPSVVFEWHPILLAAVDQDWATPFEVLVEGATSGSSGSPRRATSAISRTASTAMRPRSSPNCASPSGAGTRLALRRGRAPRGRSVPGGRGLVVHAAATRR